MISLVNYSEASVGSYNLPPFGVALGWLIIMTGLLFIPIFAIILGYLLLGEALNIQAIIGSIVILIGTYLSLELSIKKMLKPKDKTQTNSI